MGGYVMPSRTDFRSLGRLKSPLDEVNLKGMALQFVQDKRPSSTRAITGVANGKSLGSALCAHTIGYQTIVLH